MNETPKYEVFISYRRDGGVDYARMIYLELKGRGFNTFFDFNSLRSGKFNEGIFQAIDDCRYFILVLSENALDRCMNEDDWVRREIEYALSKGKEIIPVCPSGCTRGFPAEMPPSFSSLRDIQVSRIDMDDLFEKSFDKIVEDRFDADFRKGRDPVGAGGVSNRSFTKIGICVVAAILVAASAVTTAIMLTKRSDDQPVATEPARAAGRAPSGVYVFASGSPELKLREQLSRVRQLQTLLKVNGWNTADPEYVKAAALLGEAYEMEWGDRRQAAAAFENFRQAEQVFSVQANRLVERKFGEIGQELLEDMDLSGDRKLKVELERVNRILPICRTNATVVARKTELEAELFPTMRVEVRCGGVAVPAEMSLTVPTERRDGSCMFCRAKGIKVPDPGCIICKTCLEPSCDVGCSSFDAECPFCQQKKNRRTWLKVSKDRQQPRWLHDGEVWLPAGTAFSSPKQFMLSKNEAVGVITAKYFKDGVSYSGRTGKIVANWRGTTNVVIELLRLETPKAGEVRVVPLPNGENIEFAWCPAGAFEFEYAASSENMPKVGRVSVKKGFWISRYELTRSQVWAMGGQLTADSDDPPVFITDLKRLCEIPEALQEVIGGNADVRLPTAAEWELAARGGAAVVDASTQAEYGWLDEPGTKDMEGDRVRDVTWKFHAPGGRKPNGLGLYDMYGNAEEWVVGTVDAELGLKPPRGPSCDHCGTQMTLKGGSVRMTATNAVMVLTRAYMKARNPHACLMSSSAEARAKQYETEGQWKWSLEGAIRLVAEELPTTEEIRRKFVGRHWLCQNCGAFAMSLGKPEGKDCKGGVHAWKKRDLPEGQLFGPRPLVCENCGIRKPRDEQEEKNDCRLGVHDWRWLADYGPSKYRCTHCEKELMTCKRPESGVCPGPAGKPRERDWRGREKTYSHEWEKVKDDDAESRDGK